MYSLTRLLSRRDILVQQVPALGTSLLIAELFYKFGSFGLEAIAFLATWFVLDAAIQALDALVGSTQRTKGAATVADTTGSATIPDANSSDDAIVEQIDHAANGVDNSTNGGYDDR